MWAAPRAASATGSEAKRAARRAPAHAAERRGSGGPQCQLAGGTACGIGAGRGLAAAALLLVAGRPLISVEGVASAAAPGGAPARAGAAAARTTGFTTKLPSRMRLVPRCRCCTASDVTCAPLSLMGLGVCGCPSALGSEVCGCPSALWSPPAALTAVPWLWPAWRELSRAPLLPPRQPRGSRKEYRLPLPAELSLATSSSALAAGLAPALDRCHRSVNPGRREEDSATRWLLAAAVVLLLRLLAWPTCLQIEGVESNRDD